MSNTLHKLKEAVHPTTNEYGEPVGSHHSAAAPRTTHAAPGVHHGHHGSAVAPEAAYQTSGNYTTSHHGHHTAAGAGAALPGPAPTTAGPHRHDILNKLDPSVDSKGVGQTVPGGVARPPQPVAGLPGPATTTGGPHKSNLMNKLDPNVDSRTGEMKQPHAGAAPVSGSHHHATAAPVAGTHHHAAAGHAARSDVPEGSYGPHKSRIANALDPRVDSDLDHSGARTHGHAAPVPVGHHSAPHHAPVGAALPGPAPNTAGPHRSDLMNKLDPSVDSKTGEVRGSAAPAAGTVPVHGGAHHAHSHAAPTMHGAGGPGPAPTTAGPHRSDLLNKLDPTVDSKPHGSVRY